MSACTNSTKVVFLGDSITAAGVYDKEVAEPWGDTFVYPKATGFITLLNENVGDNMELIGKGVSGDKVSDLLTRYKDDVMKLNPDIVFIYIGINDVWHKYDFGTGSDIDFYESGLRKIIYDIKKQGADIVLCTPTLIGENSGEFTLVNQFKDVETMERMNGDLDAFSDVIRKLSTELNTDLLDLREIFMTYVSENNLDNEPAGLLTYDGVHLNDLGNKLIADEMMKFLD
ncbi:GDSL-type esterase/lipase family protein [Flavobacteriaceae bacterium]|nr:GDSL-type esterase/lipase family protein [Flavobacteriaceae bacterium]